MRRQRQTLLALWLAPWLVLPLAGAVCPCSVPAAMAAPTRVHASQPAFVPLSAVRGVFVTRLSHGRDHCICGANARIAPAAARSAPAPVAVPAPAASAETHSAAHAAPAVTGPSPPAGASRFSLRI